MNTATVFLLMASVLAPPVKTSPERSTRIYVRTIPPGASVMLDGKELGTTDGLFLVPPGVRTITLEMDGYDPKAERVDVREGWITRVEVRLEQARKKPGETAETRLERIHFDAQGIPTVDGKPATLNDVRVQLTQLKQPRTTQVVLVFPAATPFCEMPGDSDKHERLEGRVGVVRCFDGGREG